MSKWVSGTIAQTETASNARALRPDVPRFAEGRSEGALDSRSTGVAAIRHKAVHEVIYAVCCVLR